MLFCKYLDGETICCSALLVPALAQILSRYSNCYIDISMANVLIAKSTCDGTSVIDFRDRT